MPKKKPAIPRHVAIIPDGNRRWAKKRGLRPWEGHLCGIGSFAQDIAWAAFGSGVKYLTVWGGSYDNLTKRSGIEIRMLNEAYRRLVKQALEDEQIHNRGVRIRFIGEWRSVLESKTIELIDKIQDSTRDYKNHNLTILVAYNGDKEILDAIRRIPKEKIKRLTSETLKSYLWTSDLPSVDFIIRTGVGNDPHISAGFMMWDTRYSQLLFTKKLWPDFSKKDLELALENYSRRERRLGK